MRVVARVLLSGLLASVLLAVGVSAAQAAEEAPAIEKFVAVNCEAAGCAQKVTNVNLGPPFGEQEYSEPQEPTKEEAENEGAVQAGERVPFGITDFKVATEGSFPVQKPKAKVNHIRTDVAPGLSTNPFAVSQCSISEFDANAKEEEAFQGSGLGFYPAPTCAESGEKDAVIGENKATVYLENPGIDLALSGTAYNLQATKGLASEFGVALKLPIAVSAGGLKQFFEFLEAHSLPAPGKTEQETAEAQQYYAHTLIEGNVEWGKQARGTNQGDYHDYFEIKVSTALPLISSRLVFEGRKGAGDFITNPTSCPGHNTTTLKLSGEGGTATGEYTTPIGLSGCGSLLFEPGFALTPGTTQSDQPDAFTAAASEPHNPATNDQSQVKSASFTLPEGMTLNPSAAKGLAACTSAQAHIHSEKFGVECPEASKLGTVTLDVPDLPDGSLTGAAYLGAPESGTITGPPYTMYIVANSEQYGVSVRLEAQVFPNEATGQIKTVINEPPEQPFSNLSIQFERGQLAPIANPLSCGAATAMTSFTPFSGTAAQSPISGFVVDSNGSGGQCGASILALNQNISNSSSTAGAYTSFGLTLERGDGQQYLTKVSTTLPEGLLGMVSSVPLCGEAEANAGTCSVNSRIGTATVKAGAGKEPYSFSGPMYLTGPYSGAPYGLSIVVPTAAGPFNFGNEVVRATINVNPTTTQLTVTASVPTIKQGVPLRIKDMTVAVEREKFMFNPTNCGALATATSLNGTPTLPAVAGAMQGISTSFQVQGCSSLAFAPKFSASTNGKTTRATGASLNVKIGYTSGQANLKYVKTTLPKQLPSRLTTLNKACPLATFTANPAACPAGATVGTATATTPVLPNPMTGPAILVSHGGAAFPDLEFVLSGNNVTVIIDGTTNISKGITTSTFAAIPDVPVSSFALSLPSGSDSLLSANGSLCTKSLVMPTVLEGQNGTKLTQNTKISTSGCGVVISAHKVKRHTATLTVYVPSGGKVSASGSHLKTISKKVSKSGTAYTVKVSLSKAGVATLDRKGKLKVKIKVGFKPTKGSSSKASVTVTFKR